MLVLFALLFSCCRHLTHASLLSFLAAAAAAALADGDVVASSNGVLMLVFSLV
jgi:hypothetical protein